MISRSALKVRNVASAANLAARAKNPAHKAFRRLSPSSPHDASTTPSSLAISDNQRSKLGFDRSADRSVPESMARSV